MYPIGGRRFSGCGQFPGTGRGFAGLRGSLRFGWGGFFCSRLFLYPIRRGFGAFFCGGDQAARFGALPGGKRLQPGEGIFKPGGRRFGGGLCGLFGSGRFRLGGLGRFLSLGGLRRFRFGSG